jgi:hypothetical protein
MIPNFYIIEKDQEQTVGFDVDVTFDMEGVKNYITTEITNVEFINGRVLNNHTTYAKVAINIYDATWLGELCEANTLAQTVRFFNKIAKEPHILTRMLNEVYSEIKTSKLFKQYMAASCHKVTECELLKKKPIRGKPGYYELYITYK